MYPVATSSSSSLWKQRRRCRKPGQCVPCCCYCYCYYLLFSPYSVVYNPLVPCFLWLEYTSLAPQPTPSLTHIHTHTHYVSLSYVFVPCTLHIPPRRQDRHREAFVDELYCTVLSSPASIRDPTSPTFPDYPSAFTCLVSL
ncbi:hypothetical protein LY76DRAFT_79794 [Colletotrichum caudatum]|nr:hypothetical protein LY76DRAFT_79794 [Colletotrichum caudatum]